MGFRDDREAERARIDALERDLADAKERAARAEAEAAAARAQASEARREAAARATRSEGTGPAKKSRAERRRDKSRRAATEAASSSSASDAWSGAGRRRYFRASYALSLVGYCAVAGVVASAGGEDAMTRSGALGACVAVVTLFIGHLVIGRVTRAPGMFNGAMITLIAAALTLGGAVLAPVLLDDLADTFAPGHPLPLAVHAVAVVVALALGSFVTAYWSSDAARSGTSSSD